MKEFAGLPVLCISCPEIKKEAVLHGQPLYIESTIIYFADLMDDWAAASLAIGTRNGEQLT